MDTTHLFGMNRVPMEDFNFHLSESLHPSAAPTATSARASVSTVGVPKVPSSKLNPSILPIAIQTLNANTSNINSLEVGKHATVGRTSAHVATDATPGMVGAHALTSGPVSRRRGLAYARHIRVVAREQFKEKRRRDLEAMGEGDRTKRRKKNDTSMTEHQKYRRRLQKNQDSAAAARFANEAFQANLEAQAEAYDLDMTRMEGKYREVSAERDAYKQLAGNLQIELRHCREAIALLTRQAQSREPEDNQQRAHYDQLLAALTPTLTAAAIAPIPVTQKSRLDTNCVTSFDFETYHGAPFAIEQQGGYKSSLPA